MDKLYWLNQIQAQDRTQVGEKAFHLSRVVQDGYSVVPGFVVAAEIFREFLENLSSSEALVADLPYSSLHLDVDNWRQLQQVSQKLRQEISTAEVSPELINHILQACKIWNNGTIVFRSSLVVLGLKNELGNHPGLLQSIFCRPEPEAIAQALKSIWSQLFRARSLLYWQRVGIDLQQINLAVLVQPVYNAIASGLLNGNGSDWEIQATWGLNIPLTQGEISPDIYRIQKGTNTVLEQQLGNKILAYGLAEYGNNSQHISTENIIEVDKPCLQAYLLDSLQQQQYALSESQIQRLIDTGDQLVDKLGANFSVDWTICHIDAETQVYLTQIAAAQSVANTNFPMIQGVGAAPGRETATACVIVNPGERPQDTPPGSILIAPEINSIWLPKIQKISGIITEKGGLTSHAAILARELGIPAIVGAKDATITIQNGEQLLIDGDRGEVYRLSSGTKQLETSGWKIRNPDQVKLEANDLPDDSQDNVSLANYSPITATQLLVNLSQSSLIYKVSGFPVDGVGLLRSEMMALSILEGQHPQAWLEAGRRDQLLESWQLKILEFVRAFAPRPVFYRSLDWRYFQKNFHKGKSKDLSSNLSSIQSSVEPRQSQISYSKNSQLFELEIQALGTLQAAGYDNIRLILPLIRTVEEFTFYQDKVEEAGLTHHPEFQLWIMAEVPSVLFLLSEYVKAGVEGISIGTNDLTQLLLGIDREQVVQSKIYDCCHPVIMQAISQLIQMAEDEGIPCSICGQAPALYPEIIDKLVEWGITSISVEPEAVERTHKALARAEQRLIIAAARRQLNNK
ncbi:MAG: phosphoenolpyruvate synthase [Richelia sp.]|nr:phosphoenolpyruvate synthase [Richelia sp.]